MNHSTTVATPAKRFLVATWVFALLSIHCLSFSVLADETTATVMTKPTVEPEQTIDLSGQIKVEREKVVQASEFSISGPSLHPGNSYAFTIPSEDFGTKQVPTIKAKSCGCLKPNIVTDAKGNWSLHVQIDVSDSTKSHSYHEQLILETGLETEPFNLLQIGFEFALVQPILFECDTQTIDFQLDDVVVTGKWRKDFSVEGLTFAAAPSFEVVVGAAKIDNVANQKPYTFSGNWPLTIKSTSAEPAAYCRLNILDQEGSIRGSFAFQPLQKGRLGLLTPNTSFRRVQEGWEANLFLKVNDGVAITAEEIQSIRVSGAGISHEVSMKGRAALTVKIKATRQPSDSNVIDIKIQGLGTTCSAKVRFPGS